MAADISGRTMGTVYSVQITRCPEPGCEEPLGAAIENELQRLNALMSHYDPESELSRFNATSDKSWVSVSSELADVVASAAAISTLTGGAFDITVGASVDAWGFGPRPKPATKPLAARAPGYEQLEWRAAPPALRKATLPLQIDLSAIAKGYAVDQLSYLLESQGVSDYLVEIGGETRTAGARPDGNPWRIGIERSAAAPGASPAIQYVVVPRNAAVASSGDYRNFFELEGERVSHTINPATGAPVDNRLTGVSVIAPSAAEADALATAFMVLGAADGIALAERENIAALFTTRDGASLASTATPAFERYLLMR